MLHNTHSQINDSQINKTPEPKENQTYESLLPNQNNQRNKYKIFIIYSMLAQFTLYGFISFILNLIELKWQIVWYIKWPILWLFMIGGTALGYYLGKLKIQLNQEKHHELSALKMENEQNLSHQQQLVNDIRDLKKTLENSKLQLETIQKLKIPVLNQTEINNVNDTVKKLNQSLVSIQQLDSCTDYNKDNAVDYATTDLAPLTPVNPVAPLASLNSILENL